jgi:hypothetical protein
MDGKQRAQSTKALWAYAYQIVPAQPENRLSSIRAILEQEHTDALLRARTWAGRVVFEHQITHILVVSDSPRQNQEVNRRLESELQGMDAGFSMTVPMSVDGDAEEPLTT